MSIAGAAPAALDRQLLRARVLVCDQPFPGRDEIIRRVELGEPGKSNVLLRAPQLIVGMRITLGIAWLVVVAAEMIAVNSGLGFLIVDARNAGNRYDLVIAGMVLIGLVGIVLDLLMRRLERLDSVRWGYASQ